MTGPGAAKTTRLAVLALLLSALAAGASCGRKGDPVPPEPAAEETVEEEGAGESGY